MFDALDEALAEEEVVLIAICVPQRLSPAHDLHQIELELDLTEAVKHVLGLV